MFSAVITDIVKQFWINPIQYCASKLHVYTIKCIKHHVSQTNRQTDRQTLSQNRVKDQQTKRLIDWKTPRPVRRQWARTHRHANEEFILWTLLTKCKGLTKRIWEWGLDSIYRLSTVRSIQKRPNADILPLPSQPSLLIRDLLHDWNVYKKIPQSWTGKTL